MNILYFLIGCSVLMALIFLAAFFWALKNGQHDDVVTPGIRVLFEEEFSDNPPASHRFEKGVRKSESPEVRAEGIPLGRVRSPHS